MGSQPPNDNDTSLFLSLLDIDPHEGLEHLEKKVAGLPPAELLPRGLAALKNNDFLLALACLERAATAVDTPELASNLGFCLAKERAQFERAIELCRDAIAREPERTSYYLNLGRVLLMQGKKPEALEVYREGLRHGPDPEISADLQLVGIRRPPVIPALRRDHFLNRALGYFSRKKKPRTR